MLCNLWERGDSKIIPKGWVSVVFRCGDANKMHVFVGLAGVWPEPCSLPFACCGRGSVHGPWPLLLGPAASRACAWVRTLELIAQDPNLLNISVLQQGGHPTYSGTARTLPCCTSTLLDRACASALLFAGCSRLLLIRRRGALCGLPARLRGVARSSNRSFPRVFLRPWFLLVRLWTVG